LDYGRHPVLLIDTLEIGVPDRRDGRQNDAPLVEAAADRSLLRCARGSAVLAPEVNLVARVERGMKKVPLGPAGILKALRKTYEIDRGQERCADDLGLRVGL